MNIESLGSPFTGLSSRAKKDLAEQERKARLMARKERARNREDYGDIKVSRRIPDLIVRQVLERDQGRNFGRPNHSCDAPGPPHHIIHFEKFLHGEVSGNPHTLENLESPCTVCHKLAHEMHIPSGTSIEQFFKERFSHAKGNRK